MPLDTADHNTRAREAVRGRLLVVCSSCKGRKGLPNLEGCFVFVFPFSYFYCGLFGSTVRSVWYHVCALENK